MKFALDITSHGKTGNELFELACAGLHRLRDSEKSFGENLVTVQSWNTDLFIDGNEWMFTHTVDNGNIFLNGISPFNV